MNNSSVECDAVCFITTVSYTIKYFMMDIIERFVQDGYSTFVICSPDEEFASSLNKEVCFFPIKMERGLSVIASLSAVIKMIKLFKAKKVFGIHYASPNAALVCGIAGKIVGVPVRIYNQWGIRYCGFSGMKREVFKCLEKITCSLATHIRPDSYDNLSFGISEKLYKAEKAKVIGNGSAAGIDLNKFDISKKAIWRDEMTERYNLNGKTVFGFVGRLDVDKGVNELLRAYRDICEEKPSVLLVIGWADKVQTLDAGLLNWAKKNDSVIFTGSVNDVERYYAAMDCLVLPSYREGFGNVVIEAGAMQVPVIATKILGPGGTVREGNMGMLVPPRDYAALAEAMRALRDAPQMSEYYARNGEAFVHANFESGKFMDKVFGDRKEILYEYKGRAI